MSNIKYFPLYLAGLSLLPCGFSICVLLYSDATEKFYPYLVIVGVTIIIAAIMNATKIYSDKFKFYNFYYLIVGNICFFISGVLLITIDGKSYNTRLISVFIIGNLIKFNFT